MNPPTIGDSRSYQVTFTNGIPAPGFPNGTPTDPSTITYIVQDPTGATVTSVFGSSSIVKVSTGVYLLLVTFTKLGQWVIRAAGTGNVVAVYEWKRKVVPSGINSLN